MKGVGRIKGWIVFDRRKDSIWWINSELNRDVYLRKEGKKWILSFYKNQRKSRRYVFNSQREGLARARKYMLQYAGYKEKRTGKKKTHKRKKTTKRKTHRSKPKRDIFGFKVGNWL